MTTPLPDSQAIQSPLPGEPLNPGNANDLPQNIAAATVAASQMTVEISQLRLPPIDPDGGLLQVEYCGVCGSDLDKLVHRKSPSGMVLGHEVSGTLVALGPQYQGPFSVGDRIVTAHHVPCQTCHYCQQGSPSMCRQFKATNLNPGGFSQYTALSAQHLQHIAFKIPDHCPSLRATAVEPLGCILRAVERGNPLKTHGQHVMVVGLGFIGQLAAQVYKTQGHTVYGIDRMAQRVDLALSQNFLHHGYTSPEALSACQRDIAEQTPCGGVDTVFLTAVTPEILDFSWACLRDGGTLVLFAGPSGIPGTVQIPPEVLYFREIQVISSYSPSIESLSQAAQLIFERKIAIDPLLDMEVTLKDLPQAIEDYRTGRIMKAVLSFQEMDP